MRIFAPNLDGKMRKTNEEDKCRHGLNTDETRIHFRVQSVFHPWLPPTFVSFVYFVVPIVRGKGFDRNMEYRNIMVSNKWCLNHPQAGIPDPILTQS